METKQTNINTTWKDDLKKGTNIDDDELRATAKMTFQTDNPTIEESQYGLQRHFDVVMNGIPRKLRASNRLARILAKFPSLKGKTFTILRQGEKFTTNYIVTEVK